MSTYNTMTIVPRAAKTPATNVVATSLFESCQSETVPAINGPKILGLVNGFKGMRQLRSWPQLTLPTIADMTHAFDGCVALTGDIPYTNPKGFCIWDQAFINCTRIQRVPLSFFMAGSSYVETFKGCTELTGMAESMATSSTIAFPGTSYQNTFRGCTKFVLSPAKVSTSSSVYIRFPSATSIAGCFYNTLALNTNSNSTRSFLDVGAPYAEYADSFMSLVNTTSKKVSTLNIKLPRIKAAEGLFSSGILVRDNVQFIGTILPDNDNPLNGNILSGLIYEGGSEISLTIEYDSSVPELSKTLTRKMLSVIQSKSNWGYIQFNFMDIDMKDINDVQNFTYTTDISTADYGRCVKFYGCNFTNKTGITALNDVDTVCMLYCSNGCTNVDILRNCVSSTHSLSVR